ncbi:ATP-binding cassette domain-containing protein [Brevibacillus ruminantium]|uniref:ATP-binding cassette domain-containing protein n=1 Tax=Brevibacillus ruminantium TaxID=2950604 RepID=A0ABY4W7W9_9BACL|nr:ATP-binding cassette domain-containing protein [Brevibacillus ruminantium]USG63291.1 ATP-binding cassette domain-containing protein [Brevibacillus ruminantium]
MLTLLKNLLGYIRPYKWLTVVFFTALCFDLAFVSLAPLSFKFIIDKAIEPGDSAFFFSFIRTFAIIGLFCMSMGVVSDYALAKLNANVQTELRRRLFDQLQHLPIGFFQKARSGDLVSYFSVDLPAIETAMVVILTTGIQSFTVVILSTIVLFSLEWSMALLILAGAAFVFCGPYLLGRRAQAVNAAYIERLSLITSDVHENMRAQKVIKGFHLQQAMIEKFNKRLQSFSLSFYNKQLINTKLERLPMISLLLVNFSIMGVGSYLALQGYITLGALVAFFTMYMSMGNSVFGLTFTIPALTEARVSMERIEQLLKLPRESFGTTVDRVRLQRGMLDIHVEQVTFGYEPDKPVLKQINLRIPAGTTAAFVGSSGSGKSTMLQLLLGFYDPQTGDICLNGTRMQDLDRSSFREQIGIVFQENFLFRGSILENIRISRPDASREEIMLAAQKAEIHDYICSLPEGYDTEVVDDGHNFSGGQRQRLAIARAILRDPPLLLLDEATSALDPIAEAAINRTFQALSDDRTVITVTHRLASITGSDQIFVFDQGELVDSGTHLELLQKGGYYQQLWEKQSGLIVSQDGLEAEVDEERLSRLPFFRGIDPKVLSEMTSLFDSESCLPGQSVIREGESGEKFYLIARGRVEITKAASAPQEGIISLAMLEDGDYFGEIALLENVPRTATVTAITPCVFLTLKRKALYHILSRYPEIDEQVWQTIMQRRN